ncbi:MAG: type I-E CRISPR-associated protein Cse1/CasA [Acidimicrobiaceae bacterium]|nr:type I-E CRISPR-associated protein Cse1/CasA [Acidimicrobiaceae bacterium]
MSDSRGFNLVDDAWIPIGGREVSLSDALTEAHELPGWPDGEPGFAAVLLRLMAIITYRVTGLDDETLDRAQFAERQKQLLDEGRMDSGRVRQYLTQHYDRFWLLNPPSGLTPFAQDTALASTAPHAAAKAVVSWASGDNPSLGPHGECATIPAAVAARHLLIQRSYAICGTSTPHPVTGHSRGYVQNGALRKTASLHPMGATLAATLVGHLVPRSADGTGFGMAYWEAPPPINPVAAHVGIPGLLEQIAGRQDKTMLLRADGNMSVTGFTIAEGPGVDPSLRYRDPYLLVDAELEPLKPRPGRAFWREAESLLAQDDQGKRQLSAAVLDWAREKWTSAIYDPQAFSWTAISHNGDRSKELTWATSTSPDLLHLFESDAAVRANDFLALASEAEERMVNQIAKVYKSPRPSEDPYGRVCLIPHKGRQVYEILDVLCRSARAEFWRRSESDFWDSALDRLDTRTMTDKLRNHALAGYDTATAGLLHNSRAHMIAVESRRWVAAWQRRSSATTESPEGVDAHGIRRTN